MGQLQTSQTLMMARTTFSALGCFMHALALLAAVIVSTWRLASRAVGGVSYSHEHILYRLLHNSVGDGRFLFGKEL